LSSCTANIGQVESNLETDGTMKKGKPSATAEGNAALRAAEWLRPEDERVCYDQFARRFLGLRFGVVVRSRLLTRIALWYAERILPGAADSLAARTRYIDDYLKQCIDDGIEQLVILGAGYDSRAYRFDELRPRVRVFEVDHPDTQRAKIQKVKRIFGSLPSHVVYVGLDLDEKKLGEGLLEAGYRKDKKTLFIWEGVTVYLTPEAVDETLAFVAGNSGKGSSIIFDYAFQFALDATSDSEEAKKWRKAYERRGEPPKFALKEDEVEEFLSKRGFYQVKSVSMESLENIYFRSKGITRKVTRLGGMVHADVVQ
jgi:methyltransferase (TIGR00027 family)